MDAIKYKDIRRTMYHVNTHYKLAYLTLRLYYTDS
jgi:hypothetical protein